MTAAGTCFGFQIEAPQELHLVRGGDGDPLKVEEMDHFVRPPDAQPLMQWVATPENPLDATLYESDIPGTYLLWIGGDGVYRIDPASGVIAASPAKDLLLREVRLLGLPLLLNFLHRGDLSLHGAAVEVDGGAIVLVAPGRHGKTSLAAGFVAAGHRLLSEDLCCVRLGNQISLIPGPAGLRIRADMHELLPLPGTEIVGPFGDRTLVAVTTGLRGTCDPVPLKAIVLLKDFSDEFLLERLDPLSSLRDLWFLSLNLPSDSDRARKLAGLTDIATAVSLWSLERPLGVARLPETVERLIGAVDG